MKRSIRREIEHETKKREYLITCYHHCVQKGLENVTMRGLATACGVQQGTLYYYFPSKEELILECAHYGTDRVFKTLFSFENCKGTLDAFTERFLDNTLELRQEIRFIFQLLSSTNFEETFSVMSKSVEDTIMRGIEEVAEGVGLKKEDLFLRAAIFLTSASVFTLLNDREQAKQILVYGRSNDANDYGKLYTRLNNEKKF